MGILAFVIATLIVALLDKVTSLELNFNELVKENWNAITQLREIVINNVTADYMTEDYYLFKWLRANNFDVEITTEKFKEHLKWRQNEKIDTILEENWEEMSISFPYSRATKDKIGRPLLYFDLGQWDIYEFSDEKGSLEFLGRWLVKMLEESNAHVRKLRADGENVTQFSLLINLKDFSLEKHGCIQCLLFYRDIATVLKAHFPFATERKVFVNVPALFEFVYSFLGEETQKLIKIYGENKSAWEPKLLEYINRDQIPGELFRQTSSAKNISTPIL